jgi:hypothetical protein
MPAGQHRLTWDAASRDGPVLSSGVYFLAMDAGGTRRTRRLVLVR